MRPPKRPESRPIVRGRGAGDRKRLAPEFEALVRGEKDWRQKAAPRPRSSKVMDPRAQALVPGVANRDARVVFDARVAELRRAIDAKDESTLARLLSEAVRLGLWRAKSVTGFDALAEEVLGLSAAQARELAKVGGANDGLETGRLGERDVAVWMRAESALLELGKGSVSIRVQDGKIVMSTSSSLEHAPDVMRALGRRLGFFAEGGDQDGSIPKSAPERRPRER